MPEDTTSVTAGSKGATGSPSEPATSAGRGLQFGRPRDWLIGAGILIAVVVAVEQSIGWSTLLEPWQHLTPEVLATAFGLTTLSYVLRAIRVYDLFGEAVAGFFPGVLKLSVLHNTANNLLPMRTGEMVFPWLMQRWFHQGFLAASASLLWIRLLDLHFLGLVGISVLWLRHPSWLYPTLGLIWLIALPLGFRALAHVHLPKRFASNGRVAKILTRLRDTAPDKPSLVARLYLWTATSWIVKLVAFATILGYFVAADTWKIMAGVMGAELSNVLPFHGVAGSGSYELATVAAMVPLGVTTKVALAGAVSMHLFLLGTTLVLGLLVLSIPRRRGQSSALRACRSDETTRK